MEPTQVVDRFIEEVWNGRRLQVLDEIFDPACVTHQLRSALGPAPAASRSPAILREEIQGWLSAFPDLAFTVDLRSVEGAHVVSWVTMRGRHVGAWMGVPATGREVAIRMVIRHRVERGRIVEDWVSVEWLGFFQQLGLVPPTPELLAQGSRGVA